MDLSCLRFILYFWYSTHSLDAWAFHIIIHQNKMLTAFFARILAEVRCFTSTHLLLSIATDIFLTSISHISKHIAIIEHELYCLMVLALFSSHYSFFLFSLLDHYTYLELTWLSLFSHTSTHFQDDPREEFCINPQIDSWINWASNPWRNPW